MWPTLRSEICLASIENRRLTSPSILVGLRYQIPFYRFPRLNSIPVCMVHGEFARRYLDLPYCLYPFAAWYATIVPFFSRSGWEARSHVPYLIPFSSFDKIFHWKATFSTVDDSQLDPHSQNGLSRFYQTDTLFLSILKFHPRDSFSLSIPIQTIHTYRKFLCISVFPLKLPRAARTKGLLGVLI